MELKNNPVNEVKKDTIKLNFIDRIKYSIEMKKVKRVIRKARMQNKNECFFNYCVMEFTKEKLKDEGYEVCTGKSQAIYYCSKYTHIKW